MSQRVFPLWSCALIVILAIAALPPARLSAQSGSTPAEMVSPAPGSALSSSTVTFSWTSGSGVSQYWLWVGTQLGANDVYSQSAGTSLSTTVSNVPTNIVVYVRLWSMLSEGWRSNDYAYGPGSATSSPIPTGTASQTATATPTVTSTAAEMISPPPGSALTS